MINIIVVSHGNLADELINSAKMIIGECDSVFGVSLQPDETPEAFTEKINSIMVDLAGQEMLILIDMFSGTPSNIVARLVVNKNVECLTGVNLPMLIEAILSREGSDVRELATLIAEIGTQSIKNLKPVFK